MTAPEPAFREQRFASRPRLEEHRARGFGRFLTRADLEKLRDRRLGDALRQMHGARIINGRANNAWLSTTRAGGGGTSIMGHGSNALDGDDVVRGAVPACYAMVYLDGYPVYRGTPREPLFNLNSLTAADVESLEFYSSPSQLPPRYSGLNTQCGVLVIHTRRYAPKDP